MDQQIIHTDESAEMSAEKLEIAKDVRDAIDRMSVSSLGKLRAFAAGMQAAEEVKKAG